MSPMKFKHKICLLKTHVAASPPQHAHMRTDTRTHMHTQAHSYQKNTACQKIFTN